MSGWKRAGAVLAGVCATAAPAAAYSVLSHEQVIDVRWSDTIEPLLRQRFPRASEEEIRRAHAYAYGGSVVPDLGYYPFGSHYFTDLLHYARSGDFVAALVEDARDVDEYAFALGALAHYCSDSSGHPAVNRSVALGFPKLRARYGDRVTYVESPVAHIRTEFGFDVVQVAKGRYTSDRYHDFIGFEVSKPALERALLDTYGLKLDDALAHPDLAVGTFRRAVSEAIPELTRIALASRRLSDVPEPATPAERRFVYVLSRADYEKEWGTSYRRPGLFGRVVAFFARLVSHLGPFRKARAQVPTRETEQLYVESMDRTLDLYRERLREAGRGKLALPNLDLDTGQPARFGEYALADRTYARLLHEHAGGGFGAASSALRRALADFYRDTSRPSETKKKHDEWLRTLAELRQLEAAPAPPPR
jgi:hypothetical protein